MSMTLEEAQSLAIQYAPVLEEEYAALPEAVGRILTQDIRSSLFQPPFDRSPLDGYAVIAVDIAAATPETPVKLQVVDKLWAGMPARNGVKHGQAVRLMTGCMLPPGVDAGGNGSGSRDCSDLPHTDHRRSVGGTEGPAGAGYQNCCGLCWRISKNNWRTSRRLPLRQ